MSWQRDLLAITAVCLLIALPGDAVQAAPFPDATPSIAFWDARTPQTVLAARSNQNDFPAALARPSGVDIRNASIEEALSALHEATGLPLLFSPSRLPKVRVSCECRHLSVGETLARLLDEAGLAFVMREGQAVIFPEQAANVVIGSPRLPPVYGPTTALASPVRELTPQRVAPLTVRQGTVVGRVTDAQSGEPLAVVQVHIPTLSVGALSAADGTYAIPNVPAGTHAVRAQRLGYRLATMDVTVVSGGSVTADFQLTLSALALDEVIVTGTPGGTRLRAIGNQVGRVDAAALTEVAPVQTLQDLLGGREPGLNFNRASGNIGTGSQVRIRGMSSVAMGNQPLVYVDGVRVDNAGQSGPNIRDGRQVSTLDDFSPEEIESIEIIKGPAASTLYGTEASAGVIQIITKRGAVGAPQFDVSIRQGATWLADFSRMVGDSYARDDDGNVISFNVYEAERAAGRNHLQVGHLQSYSASMRGGTDFARYYLSADYDNDTGIVSYNWKKQTNVRANLTVLPSDDFTLDVSLGYLDGLTRFMQQRTNWGVWEQFQWANPSGQDRILRGFLRARPEEIANVEAYRDNKRFTGSATVTHVPTEWLTHRLVVGIDQSLEENSILFPRHPDGANHDFGGLSLGELEVERPNRQYRTLDYSASLMYGTSPELRMTSSFGVQYYARTETEVRALGRIFPAPQIRTLSGAANTAASQTFVENKSLGVYLQQEVGFRDRVFLTAAVRGDDNSAFGADFDAAIYPKFSATWVISEEPFWRRWEHVVSSLRLRSAWGKAGRQPDTFAAVTLYEPEVGPAGNPAVTTGVLGNADLGPEVSTEIEVGFDAAFLDERLTAEFTYYNQKVTDALVDVPVSPVSGFSGSQSVNLGELSNRGWEAKIDARVYEGTNLTWGLGAGLSSNENEVDDLGGVLPTNTLLEGRPFPFFSRRQAIAGSIDPQSGAVVGLMCDGGAGFDGRSRGGEPTPCLQAPLLQVGNGLYIPKYEAQFNTSLTLFGNLRLYAMVEWQGEHYKYAHDMNCRHTCFYTSRAAVERPPEYVYAVAMIDGLIPAGVHTSTFNASFAKLREVSATYTLPSTLVGRMGASRAAINVAARNLWTIWVAQKDVAGAPVPDPEIRNAGGLTLFSNSNIPPTTSFVTTLRVSF